MKVKMATICPTVSRATRRSRRPIVFAGAKASRDCRRGPGYAIALARSRTKGTDRPTSHRFNSGGKSSADALTPGRGGRAPGGAGL